MSSTLVYSTNTVTVDRGVRVVVELECEAGYRFWSRPMWESSVSAYVAQHSPYYWVSDIDRCG